MLADTIYNLQKLRRVLRKRRHDEVNLQRIRQLEDDLYQANERIASFERDLAEQVRSHNVVREENDRLKASATEKTKEIYDLRQKVYDMDKRISDQDSSSRSGSRSCSGSPSPSEESDDGTTHVDSLSTGEKSHRLTKICY